MIFFKLLIIFEYSRNNLCTFEFHTTMCTHFTFVLIEINGCFRRLLQWQVAEVWDGDKYRKVIVPVVTKAIAIKSVKKCTVKDDSRNANQQQEMKKEFCTDANISLSSERKVNSRTEVSSFEDIVEKGNTENDEMEVDQVLNEVRNACPFCSKRFGCERSLKRHIVKSHEKRAYKCDMCRTSCSTEQRLAEHRKTHSDDYFFKCDICHKKYKRRENMQHHQLRAHNDNAVQFVCDSCGQSFKLKADLIFHIKKKHSTNTPIYHICLYCGKSVTDIYSHERKHKEQTENSSKFSCQICSNKFKNQTRLDNHLLLHKQGYKCTKCNLVLTSSKKLKYHKNRMHKPNLICPICKKIFVSKGNHFNQHILAHGDIRPYKCDICDKHFTQRSSLFRHRKNHPGPLPPYKSQIPIAGLVKNFLQTLKQ